MFYTLGKIIMFLFLVYFFAKFVVNLILECTRSKHEDHQ